MKTILSGSLALTALFLAACSTAATGDLPPSIKLTDEQALAIGHKIFLNEAGGKIEFLTHWNAGEEFASLGIGHFIWYPENYHGPFEESFPEMLTFLQRNGAAPPAWVASAAHCPWKSKAEFDAKKNSPDTLALRDYLAATIALQARFAANRLEKALPKILLSLPDAEQDAVRSQFYRVAQDPRGVYALMDYVNFKGEGVSPTERYAGHGWGLLQVLQGMKGTKPGDPALDEFVASADAALTLRVKNSPPERHEEKWLGPWRNRLQTYRKP